MIFTKDFIKIDNEGQTIIGNKDNGTWMRISTECMKILEQAVEENLDRDELLKVFQDKDDKAYFRELLDKLFEIEVIAYSEGKRPLECMFESFEIMLTHRCNLSCIHCCVDSRSASSPDYFNTAEMIGIIQKIINCKPQSIVLTGGEPMLREDFMTLLKYISENSNAAVTLMTNGTFITKDNVASISKMIDSVDISVDGVDEDTCSAIRGPNVFKKVINSVNLLQQHMAGNISLSMVSCGNNVALEKEFYSLCKRLNVIPVVREIDYSGRALVNKETIDSIMCVDKTDTDCFEPNYSAHREMINLSICKAGKKSFSIEANGDIVACSIAKTDRNIIGNINNISDLADYLRRNEAPIRISDDSKCGKCKYNRFCCSCPDLMEKMQEKEDFEEYCQWKKEWIEKVLWEN